MTFCATANAVIHAGARPVFVDVEETTGNIDAERIEAAITDRTRAIIPVHLYGHMCDMKRIRQIADARGLIVIEDAAHCIEGNRDGVGVGQLSEAACFSFYATKNITSGEGGAIATNDSEKAELLKMLRLHGIDKSAADRYTKRYRHWDMPVLGWKYNMDNIQAALLLGQLERIDSLLEKRAAVYSRYADAFRDAGGIRLLSILSDTRSSMHLFTILMNDRDSVLTFLQERGIGVAVNYRAVHLLKYFRERFGYKEGDFPVAEKIGDSTISLPLYPDIKEEAVSYVIKNVLEAAAGIA
jgi:UDP-4-amino-4-deoxy-L-arabinose-oxoglutarate aminotransferase